MCVSTTTLVHILIYQVVWVTATAPYFLVTILLCYGATLPGSLDGVKFFIIPDWSKLLEGSVWLEASIQVLYQLGPAWGGLLTMASFNEFNTNVYRDAWAVTAANFLTALYSGFAIFSILGFMAFRYGVPVEEVAKSGPGLAFIAYPEAIAHMPFSQLWAVIFFLTLITVGLDSQFGTFDTMVSGLLDTYPHLRRHKVMITGGMAFVCFLLGLPFITEGGMYLYQIVDWYSSALTFSMVGFLEVIVVCYIYGIDRFCSDAELMFGFQPSRAVRIMWLVFTPLMTATMLFVGLWNLKPPHYPYSNYTYPGVI